MARQYESPPEAAPREQPREQVPSPLSPSPSFHTLKSGGRENATLIIGALLVVFGVLFLLGQTLNLPVDWSRYGWPVFVIAPGLALFVVMAAGGKSWGGLAVPASIVTVVGLILFVQNTLDLWQTWSYAWALVFPMAAGLGTWIEGIWCEDPSLKQRGQHLLTVGVTLFLVFAAFFEGVLGISHLGATQVARIGIPTALIVAGILLLASRATERHPTD